MKYFSIFSGVEAASVAWEPLGWTPVGFAEIEKFPSEVLKQRFPDIPNFGDVTKIGEKELKTLGNFELLVGGSPCQNLSFAGNRKGLSGDQSSLFVEQMRIFELARRINGTRYMLWENVPGAFSTNQGEDFRTVLESMVGRLPRRSEPWKTAGVAISEDGCRIAEWRTLDAQYFGVPQRRRRIFIVLDTGAWWDRRPILFEQGSSKRDFEEIRESRETSSPQTESGSGIYCLEKSVPSRGEDDSKYGLGVLEDKSYTLLTSANPHIVAYQSCVRRGGVTESSEVVPPLMSSRYNMPFVQEFKKEEVYVIQGSMIGRKDKNGPQGSGININKSFTLNTIDKHAVAFNEKEVLAIRTNQTGSNGRGISDKAYTLDQTVGQAIAYDMKERHNPQPTENVNLTTRNCATVRGDTPLLEESFLANEKEITGPLTTTSWKGCSNQDLATGNFHIIEKGNIISTVRRFTPKESERLQGFPDDWTNIVWRDKHPAPDSHRYKAMGNSMAVPVMRWIGEQFNLSVKKS